MKWSILSKHKKPSESIVFPYCEVLEQVLTLSKALPKDKFLKRFHHKYHSLLSKPQQFLDWSNFYSDKIFEKIENYPSIATKPHQNKFIDFSIQSYLEKTPHIVQKFQTRINNIQIVLNIKSFAPRLSAETKQIKRLQDVIYRLICLSDWSGELTLDLWLTGCQKKLPSQTSKYQKPPCLGSPHVNGGLSSMRHLQSEKYFDCHITIFREEEIEKVLVHELIHSLYFDFKKYGDRVDNYLYQHLAIDSPKYVLLFEAYTEFWAVLFYSYFRQNPMPSTAIEEEQAISTHILDVIAGKCSWSRDYNKNLEFSFQQAAKILAFFGFVKAEQILDGQLQLFSQKSGIFSYYIIKTALLFSIRDMLDWCVRHQSKRKARSTLWIFPVSRTNDDSLVMAFAVFCLECLHNTGFLTKLDYYLEQQISSPSKDDSLMMTYYGKIQ
jgi:hypothetical protein